MFEYARLQLRLLFSEVVLRLLADSGAVCLFGPYKNAGPKSCKHGCEVLSSLVPLHFYPNERVSEQAYRSAVGVTCY